MTKKVNSLEVLTAMHEAQADQFQRATLLAIGVVMRKLGVDNVSIHPDDVNSIARDEVMTVTKNVNGSLNYSITKRDGQTH